MKRPTTHLAPPPGDLTTPCCGKALPALPIGDRLVFERARVTCGRSK